MILRGFKEVNWKTAKGMMAETNFLASLQNMDVDGITQNQVGSLVPRRHLAFVTCSPIFQLCMAEFGRRLQSRILWTYQCIEVNVRQIHDC